ncbi:hypothetical protein, partial [Candidatus Ichthyocystis sparus]
MYPVSSVTSGATASNGDPDNEDDGGTKGGTVQGDDLQQVKVTTLPASVGKGVSNRGKGKDQNLRSVFVKSLFCRDQPGNVSATSAVSTVVTPPEDKGVLRTSSKGKAPALKRGTSISSSAFTIDSDVLNSMGVMLSPDAVRVIECLFFKMDAFARRTYKSMVAKQLPSDVSGKLTITGRAIWYLTYKVMCEDSFLFKCLGKYHYKHRPNFIRALPSIQVLSDSTDHSTEPLAGDRLLDFLSVL